MFSYTKIVVNMHNFAPLHPQFHSVISTEMRHEKGLTNPRKGYMINM